MRTAYRRYEGYKTCLLIRNGPLRETPAPEMTLDGDSAFAVTPQDAWPVRPGRRR